MVSLKADFKVKINKGLVQLPDSLNKLTSESFNKMISNPDLRFKFALKHNLSINVLDDDESFASNFVTKYDSWLSYSKSSKNLIITILTQHPRQSPKSLFNDFSSLDDSNLPIVYTVNRRDVSGYLRQILSNQFTIDLLNFITSTPGYSVEKITPFIFRNILFFSLTFQTLTNEESWSDFKTPLESGDSKEKFTYKSIMSSFVHALENWFLYFYNIESISTVFTNLTYDNCQEARLAIEDFILIFPYLNIISYTKHIQCMPEDSSYLKIKSFMTAVEYMNSKVKDTLGPRGFAPLFSFDCESELSEYHDTWLNCHIKDDELDEFKGHINRIFNPIHSSLNNSCFSFIDSSVYTKHVSEYTQSFKRSCRDTYVFGFSESNDFHKLVKKKSKLPMFSTSFTDSHFGLTRHSIASALYNSNSESIFKGRLKNKLQSTELLEVNSKIHSYFINVFQLFSLNSFSYFDNGPIDIHAFSPFFIPRSYNGLSKLISDAPTAPLNWLNNNNSVYIPKSTELSSQGPINCLHLSVTDTYNHSSAVSNGLKMNNCIDRFTLPVSSGISEVIIFQSTVEMLSEWKKLILAKLIDKYNLSSSIDLFVDSMDLTSHKIIGYEGGIRASYNHNYENDYGYYQFNAHSNYNYTLNTYTKTGKFVAGTFPFYAILSNYLLSLPSADEAYELLDSENSSLDETATMVMLLLNTQRGYPIPEDKTKGIEHILDALEIISTISEASLLETYYQEYVSQPTGSPTVFDTDSVINTLDFVSIDHNSIYLNPSKTPSLYSYTDFFRTSDFRKPLVVEDTTIPVNISISTTENIPVNVNLFAVHYA